MADKTGISWTDSTWNPIVGCSIVSPGCTNCYAQAQAARQPDFLAALDAYEFDAECGLTCVGDVRLEQFKAEARNG